MSVAGDFQREWLRRHPESALPAAWADDVRRNLLKHRRRLAELRQELHKEEDYVEYLERLLSDIEAQQVRTASKESHDDALGDGSGNASDASEEPEVDNGENEIEEAQTRKKADGSAGHRSSINQCISEISSNLSSGVSKRHSDVPQRSDDRSDADVSIIRPHSQVVGDFVTVIEVNGLRGTDGKLKNKDETPNASSASPIEIAIAKKKIPPRPPPKVFPKRGSTLPEPDESPPTSLSNKIHEADSRESLASHSSHGTPSITERVKSYESINSLSSERKKGGTHTPSSVAAASDSLEGIEIGDVIKSAPLSFESIPAVVTEEGKDEPYYDSVPLDINEGEYVYIQAGGTSSSTDDVSSNTSTLPLTARAPLSRADPPESPGNNSNYVNIEYFIKHGAGTVGSQRSGSADSDGENDGEGSSLDTPLLLRSISVDTEASHSLAGSHTPIPSRRSQLQDGSGGDMEAERHTMQRCIISSIIESETVYVECLYVMEKYMNAIKATFHTSQPVITQDEFNTIFYKISDLHNLHKDFLEGLKYAVHQLEEPLSVGIHFKKMAENINVYGEFLHNYGRATDAVRKCCAGSQVFGGITRQISCRGQPMSLEDLLHKPVARVQKNALVLHDLIKNTPTTHPDHSMLTDALTMTQNFLDEFNIIQTKSLLPNADRAQRRLVKNSFIVELADGHRKLRHLFLFNDVIACAKYKASGREKFTFELKWFIPLVEVLIYEETASEPKENSPANIVSLKSQACTVRDQILHEEKVIEDKKMRVSGKVADKHRKKLADLEAQLVLASPNLVFRVGSKSPQRIMTFFLSSDFERTQWIDSIQALQKPLSGPSSGPSPGPAPSMLELQAWVTACRSYLNTDMGSYLMRSGHDESLLLGDLHLNIGQIVNPLDAPTDLFVCVEVDSYGHYFRKAKSQLVCCSAQPKWNETYVIELEGSQNVRVLLYDGREVQPSLKGKCILKLSRQWLGEQQCKRTLNLGNNISLSISMRFVPAEVTLRRVPISKPGALFGAKIQQVCKRQKREIPFIITACVREVERRGMTEVGIYRVSGSASDLSKLKKSFETNFYEAEQLLKEVDIHSVTGILKLYLRELPEALFTDALYPKLTQAFNGQGSGGDAIVGIVSSSNRARELQSCYSLLPDLNKKCIDFLLNHLIRINQQEGENKMSLHNLATVFGPTLLRPSLKTESGKQRDLLAAGTVDVMAQAGILYCFLQHRQLNTKTTSSKDPS